MEHSGEVDIDRERLEFELGIYRRIIYLQAQWVYRVWGYSSASQKQEYPDAQAFLFVTMGMN